MHFYSIWNIQELTVLDFIVMYTENTYPKGLNLENPTHACSHVCLHVHKGLHTHTHIKVKSFYLKKTGSYKNVAHFLVQVTIYSILSQSLPGHILTSNHL